MPDKINGRTPEEIKKGLECCIAHTPCDICPYLGTNNCMAVNTADALAYIQQLERERDALLKALKEKDAECECCANADRLEQMGTCEEMDFDCDTCKVDCRCRDCRNNSNWEWRGIQPAEKEAKDEGHTDHQPAGGPADPQGGKA